MSTAQQPYEGIAIIGMAGRFPGARNIAEFWRNLLSGEESISTLSESGSTAANYVPRRGLLDKPEYFDAAFFGITPREAEVMDPQQRVFLEECWTALEDAGVEPLRARALIGVFAGMSNNTYWAANVAHHPELIESVGALTAMMGNEKDYLATRVAYKLNLRGPAISLYTACSTSLVAVCQAVQSLLNYGCDVALAGGVSISFPQERGYEHHEGGILSPDGHCRAFDQNAAGTVFSSGAGVVVLKRLAEAVEDGDQIYAVIKGAALNNDGSSKVSFTAPSVDGHAEVIALAHALAGVDAASIRYVEAHGTGTALGDPIEIAGLTQAFRASTQARGVCAIGSLKTNVGHLDAAAGIAGLIKAALCVRTGKIPASLHFTKPHAQLGLEESPFYVNAQLADWPAGEGPRRAGVSSFGVGGTNAHCVLEQAPALLAAAPTDAPQVIVLSAKSEAALAQQASDLADAIEEFPTMLLADIAHTLQTGRSPFAHRRAFVATCREVAISALRGFEPKRLFVGTTTAQPPRVVLLFPGQGAQYLGMGAQLYASEPVFRAALDRCADLLQPALGMDLRALLQRDNDESRALLRETRITQPAIFAISYALAQLWLAWGIQPAALLGHSVGEYVAATIAGVFTLKDALQLVAARAWLVQAQARGAMLAVRMSEAEAASLLSKDIALAAVNAPKLCVLAGPEEAIAALEVALSQRGVAAKRLETSHAFHSAMMEPIIAPLTEAAAAVSKHAPTIPMMSSVIADWLTEQQISSPEYWARHARETVRFSPALARLLAEPGYVFIECGPGQTLTQLLRQQANQRTVVSSMREGGNEAEVVRAALAQLWTIGVEVTWSALHGDERHQRVSLPTYPFERKRYFAEALKTPNSEGGAVRSLEFRVQSSEFEVAPQAADALLPESRHARLTRQIIAELQSLSGTDLAGVEPSRSFVELGFDSLFLTQAAIVLHRRFRVKITFRQLLQDLPSPATLAEHLDAQLPADAPSTRDVGQAPRMLESETRTASPPKAHGPFRGIDRTSSEITAEQRTHLDQLIASYTARTAGSKRFATKHRAYLADPRAVAGFRREWKEMIYPLVCERSEGAKLWDVDDHEYTDITLGFGQILFGHRPAFLVEAIERQLHSGIEIGPTSPFAGKVAAQLSKFLRHDRVAFCNTGSEAVAAALRVARTVTGRERVAVFSGGYHGIFDEVLFRSGPAPIAPGIPQSAVANLVVLDYGSDEALAWLRAHASELAAVLVEPVQSRHPALAPREFLHELRRITAEAGAALVFDEIVTGFRVAQRGAQEFFGIEADLATYGKIIGGGMPIGILAGRREYMDALDGGDWSYGDESFPEIGVTFFAGTFVRHPLALAAASAMLDALEKAGPALQRDLEAKAHALVARLNTCLAHHDLPLHWEQFSSMYHLPLPADLRYAALIFFAMRLRGIHVWEGRPCFLSAAHTAEDIERVATAFEESVASLVMAGLLPSRAALSKLALAKNTFPLTDAQQEIFLATQLGDEASTAFNDSIALEIHGELDASLLQSAVEQVIARHDALRTTIARHGGSQTIHPSVACDVARQDLSALPFAAQDEAIEGCIARDAEEPFDLTAAPLFRCTLIQTAAQSHLFVFTAHHIVCDGWSFSIVASELAELYTATPLAAVPISFRTYAKAQHARRDTAEDHATEAWWVAQFAFPPAPLELPTDTPRAAQRSFLAATRSADLPQEVCEPLRKLAAAQRGTIFSTLLAGFYTLLHRLSGQSDLVVGIASAGQAEAGEGALVGHCVNFLPLRIALDSAQPFTVLLPRVAALVLDAREHGDFTFGRLLPKINLPRDPSRMPLVNVSFNVDRSPAALHFGESAASYSPVAKTRYGLELSLNLIEHEGGYRIFCHFNRDLFASATIERWLQHYLTLLTAASQSPDLTLGELPLVPAEEMARVLQEWNNTASDYPADSSLVALFEEQVANAPEQIAIRSGEVTLTYAELNTRANRLAHRFITGDTQPGGLIGICTERSPEFIVAMLAVLKIGCAYVPLDPTWPAERLQFMAKDGALVAMLTTALKAANFYRFEGTVLLLDDPTQAPQTLDGNPGIPASSESVACVLYTSGSTGVPKGVLLPHRAIARLVRKTDFVQIEASDVVAHVSNPAFDAMTFEVWGALLNGARLVILQKETLLSPELLSAAIQREGITTLLLTTALFNQVAMQAPETFLPLKHLLFGGEACSAACIRRVLEMGAPTRLIHAYGPTEVATIATWQLVEDVAPGVTSVPIGRPIANTTAYILDAHLQPLPAGVAGELFLGGDGLALGYLGRAELTAAAFIPHPLEPGARLYRTGDVARFLADGRIEFLTRRDGQVKLRGFRVELGEIEAELVKQRDIAAAVVKLFADQLVAYLVPRANGAPDEEELRTFLHRRLPDYMLPAIFIVLDALPLTANGKVDARALPLPTPTSTDASVAPRTATETRVATLMATTLGRESVGVTDDFFSLGGHSLLAMELMARIKTEFGVEVSAARLFAAPTVESLAAFVSQPVAVVATPTADFRFIVPIQRGETGRAPLFLVAGGWGGEIEFLVYAQIARHLGEAQPIYGLKARGAGTGEPPHENVREMAVDYLRELRSVQPHGPYLLAGECVGGICAHEMACQLREAGEEVALLMLFDTSVPSAAELANYLHAEDHRRAAENAPPPLATQLRRGVGQLVRKFIQPKAKAPRAADSGNLHPRGQEQYPITLMTHPLRPYVGAVDLIVDADSARQFGKLGWDKAQVGELRIHTLPGDHLTYIREHAETAAEKFRELLG